jgi:transposase
VGEKRLAQRGYPTVKVLCVDEIAPHKGNGGYCVMISSPGIGLLDVLKDRKKASLEAWFDARGADWCAAVEVCCADMWEAYHEAARAKLPNARQTVDRFHVMKNLNAALTTARRAISETRGRSDPSRLEGLSLVARQECGELVRGRTGQAANHVGPFRRIESLL